MRKSIQIFIFNIVLGCTMLFAFPSGGPYGPTGQAWEIPVNAGHIYYVAPDGNPDAAGATIDTPTTLPEAIAKVVTGDAIILRGGTYRTGNLALNQGITMQPWANEQPVIKGTDIATEWQDLGNGLWTTHWETLYPEKPADWWRRNREGKKTPQWKFNNDMVFVNGRFLQAVGWEGDVDQNTYYIDYETGTVYIGIDPTDKLVEITVHDAALIRTTGKVHGKKADRKGPVIRGITFTQYAYRALEIKGTEPEGISPEAEHGKMVVGTTLDNCTITCCSRVAGYLRGDSLTIRNCRISDTSTEGIYVISSNDVLLEKNIFTRNNIEQITGYYPAAVKIFNQSYRVTCRDNLIIDLPYSNGIWYDVGNVNGVFVDNWVQGVGNNSFEIATNQLWPSDNGFFFEISKGAVCTGNVFVNCDHGVMILNSSNVSIHHNTFVNSMACIGRDGRSAQGDHFGWHPSTGPDVDERDGHIFTNNLMTGGADFDRPLLFVWQPGFLCERIPNSQIAQMDDNIYIRSANNAHYPFMLWSPAGTDNCQISINDLADFKQLYPDFAKNSLHLENYNGPLYQSPELGHYRLVPGFPGKQIISDLNGKPVKQITEDRYYGAYPPVIK